MKHLLTSLFLLLSTPAIAGVPCTLPFNLQNGQIADATQVMANYNALVTCLGSAAAAGANNDITSLAGLTTPLSPSQGGTAAYLGTVASTGSANAQIVATTIPSNFNLINVGKVIFNAGFTNTGAMTLNVAGTGAKNVFRRTTDGIQALVGGEVIAGSITEVVYDGTQYQLMSNVSPFPVGTVLPTIGSTADAGFLLMQGQCLSTTTFGALFAKMGNPTFQAPCIAGQFNMPDGRGRILAQIDSGGSGRITIAGGNFDGTVLYSSGGAQNHLMAVADLVAHGHTVTVTDTGHTHTITDSGHNHTQNAHTHTITEPNSGTGHSHGLTGTATQAGSSPGSGLLTGGAVNAPVGTIGTITIANAVTGVTVNNQTATNISNTTGITGANSNTTGITAVANNSTGGGTPFTVLQPTLMLNRQIKY